MTPQKIHEINHQIATLAVKQHNKTKINNSYNQKIKTRINKTEALMKKINLMRKMKIMILIK